MAENNFMKLCIFYILILLLPVVSVAQVDSTTPPYKKFPTLPPFQILLSDSSTIYTKAQLPKKTPVFFMLFSPDCSHCQHETEELIRHKDELSNVQVVMITMHPLKDMNAFISKYRLQEMKNLIVGKDIYYILPSFYNFRNLPFMALYDKKGSLISTYEGSVDLPKVIEIFNAR